MAFGINKLAKAVADILRRDDTDRGYDTTAEVKRIEDGTAWVHFPGGEDETPVRMTVNANVGDNVQVRVSGGRAFIIGNGSAPPTDDTRANCAALAANRAQAAADKAEEDAIYAAKRAAEANERAQAAQDVATATSQHFWTDDGGVHVSSEASNATATRNTLWNSLGMLFRKGANILLAITTGATPSIDFYDGAGNAGANILASFGSAGVRIGTANATQIVLDSTNGLRLGTKVSISPSGSAKFDGEVQSTSGKIGGWDIASSSLKGEHNNKGTGFQIPSSGTWAIAVGYDTTLGTGWVSAPFRVNHSGQMWATDAHITGTITGSAGEFTQSFKVNTPIGSSGYKFVIDASTYASDGTAYLESSNSNGTKYARLWLEKELALLRGTSRASLQCGSAYLNVQSSLIEAEGAPVKVSNANFTIDHGTFTMTSGYNAYISKFGQGFDVTGSVKVSSAFGTGGKTAWNDTEHAGTWITSNGAIHMTQDGTHGGTIGFHYNFSANATSSLVETASGHIKLTGELEVSEEITSKTYNGYSRIPVGSQSDDGQRVGMIRCTSTSQAGIASQNGTAGSSYAWRNFSVSSSDIRLKKNVEDCEVEDALDVINRIKMHSFDWLHTDEHQRIGFIADELEDIDPKLAMGGGKEKDGTINYKSVDTFYLLGYLTKAVQELSEQNAKLTAELNALKEVVK